MILLIPIFFCNIACAAQNRSLYTCQDNNNTMLYIDVDELPKFQSEKFKTVLEYMYSKIDYPWQFDGQGKVIVSFVVTKYGCVEQVKIEKSLSKECDDEVKRVLYSMPKWKAGRKNNKPVDTLLLLSINFKLE